jgi:hypothetical protein
LRADKPAVLSIAISALATCSGFGKNDVVDFCALGEKVQKKKREKTCTELTHSLQVFQEEMDRITGQTCDLWSVLQARRSVDPCQMFDYGSLIEQQCASPTR